MATECDVSDTEVPSPGTSVADLSAVDRRATVDDPSTLMETISEMCINLSLSNQIKCIACQLNGIDRRFLHETQFKDHAEKQHPKLKIKWRCVACGKEFEKLRGCRCHIPKCKVETRQPEVEQFKCESCQESFASKRGLSQHERHRHPTIRNTKRIENSTTDNRKNLTARATVWTKVETELLIKLNERYKDFRQPNAAIRDYLPNKTLKQISDKRRTLVAQREESVASSSDDENENNNNNNAILTITTDNLEEDARIDVIDVSWKEPFKKEIIENQREDENEFKQIEKRSADLATCEENEVNDIVQNFIEKLKEGIKESSTEENNIKNRRNNRKGESENELRKRNKKSTRQRKFAYARCQELYKKCPKKLIDSIVTGNVIKNKEFIEPPDKKEVLPLYKGLWGEVGPQANLPKKRDVVNYTMNEIWTPITINELIDKMKKLKNDTAAGVDDIAKAFDTVPHSVLSECLKVKGIPAKIGEYVNKMYTSCVTNITCKNKETVTINLLREVKQGDPLSPLLFNLVLDPIIELIHETTEVKKCNTFQIIAKNKTWYLEDPKLKIDCQNLPNAEPEEIMKYLGVILDPWRGLQRASVKEIVDAAEGIKNLSLKPHQKVNLIRAYLLPRYIHRLVANPPPLGILDDIDKEVKQIIKKILHLHPSTTDGLIYTDKSHGGLGMQKIPNIVKIAKIRNAIKMNESEDEVVRAALKKQEYMLKRIRQIYRVALRRAKKDIDYKCRRCGVQAETLGHVLGNCTHTKSKRIKRHNEICDLILNKVNKQGAIFKEPVVNVLGELKKPDMVIKDHDRVYVVDVTVRYEDKENLAEAYKEKMRKYKETAEFIRLRVNGATAEILPIVVGCRGAMPYLTKLNLKLLGFLQKDLITVSLIALRSSIEMATEFIDYDYTI
ncbi:uncharacterized protein LOC143266162 [Megachile rotundata]|uniref:uncharacterized protein LOC143266162 n=1 Tax=Megachile rotundata TaxID=143995 RepID=UPI003FCF5741